MTIEEFHKKICRLIDDKQDQDLKDFLLKLRPIVEETKAINTVSEAYDLFLKALTTKDIQNYDFEKNGVKSPISGQLSRKFSEKSVSHLQNASSDSNTDPLEFCLSVIDFQLSELSSMEGKQLENKMRFFGVQSDAGYSWYNFTALSILECGARCMSDNEDNFDNINMGFIGHILEDGRVYE